MMRTGIIYAYTNLESGRMYVGQTLFPKKRFKQHLTDNYRQGWHIDYQNNPDKYEYSIIEMDVPEDKLDEREIYWISFFDTYNNGYNLNEGGGANKGYKHTQETKNKISNSLQGHILSKETKDKMSKAHKGKPRVKHSEETKQKISEAHKGKTFKKSKGYSHTEETKLKMSISRVGKHYYNNGVICVLSYDCPEGFVKGKLTKKNN